MSQNQVMREEKAIWRRGSPATAVTTGQLGEILAAAGLQDSVRNVELLSGGLVNSNGSIWPAARRSCSACTIAGGMASLPRWRQS